MNADIDDTFNRPRAAEPSAFGCLDTLKWSEETEIQTKLGPRLCARAFPCAKTLALWRNPTTQKTMRGMGYTIAQNKRTHCWEVTRWKKLPESISRARDEAIAASRALDVSVDLPRPEGLEYLGYQKAGIHWALSRFASLIADEMGLGKTIQAIGLINADPTLRRILIICPASLKLNWHRELRKWLVRLRPIIVCDSSICPDLSDGIIILNYDILRKHSAELHRFEYDLIVCDEAHYLKSATTIRAKEIFGYKPKKDEELEGMVEKPAIRARKKVFLTGTPICNRPAELFPIVNYLDEVTWGGKWAFYRRYCGANHENGFDTSGGTNLEELQSRLRATVMVRRLKKDVLTDLPPKRRQVIEFPPEGEAKRFIEEENRKIAERTPEFEALSARIELAKASEDPEDYKNAVDKLKKATSAAFEEMSTIRRMTGEFKVGMRSVIEHMESAVESSGKIIVFAHHKEVVAALAKALAKYGVLTIVGDTPLRERQENVELFQRDPKIGVIIGSFGPMGTGHTLTAASHVIFVELDWVPGNITQGEDRAHRIGQLNSVLVQHLVLEGSLDATMAKRIVAKQDVIDRALDKERQALEMQPDHAGKADGAATATTSREKLREEGDTMSAAQIGAAHEAMKRLAQVCNGARDWDGMGFSKIDAGIGRSLANQSFLSKPQAALARKIALKYRGQLGEALVNQLTAA